ncbi:MAG: CBS domain-containing protein [Acidobacteria bacterium]|nr:CBS domain-containing protein [Acidobacteriota bacterium]
MSEIMTREVVALRPESNLREAIAVIQKFRIRHIPVVENGKLEGIVTDRDIKRATPSLHGGVSQEDYERVLNDTRLFQVMTRDPLSVPPDASLKSVAKILVDKKYGALPVVADGVLVGIVSDIDLLRVLHDML